MRHKMLWAAVALMMMTACSSGSDEPSNIDEPIVNPENNEWNPISLTRAELQLVTANNDFAFNLFRIAGPRVPSGPAGPCFEEPEKGTILSPISITYALGMLNNGATGETLQRTHSCRLPCRPSVHLYYQRTVDRRHLLYGPLHGLLMSVRS